MFISAGTIFVYTFLLMISFYSIFAYYRHLVREEEKEKEDEVTGAGKFSGDAEITKEPPQDAPEVPAIPVPPPMADLTVAIPIPVPPPVPLDMSSGAFKYA